MYWDDTILTEGRRVGVIGTGSTGVQLVCALADGAGHLIHFARSPQWIMPGRQVAFTEEERKRFRESVAAIDAIRYGEQYQSYLKMYYTAVVEPESPEYKFFERAVIQNLEERVTDSQLREKLRPNYRPMCKRLVMSWSYYDAIQKPNVHFETNSIARIEPTGVRTADGTLHELDVIVLATGFKVDQFIRPTIVRGRGGVQLDDVWRVRPMAYQAISVPDFPNLFFLNGPSAPVGNFSLIEVAELQWAYIAQLLQKIEDGDCTHISAKPLALEEFEERRIAAAKRTIFASGCTSWYLDSEGIPGGWPWSFFVFVEAMRTPIFEHYDMRVRACATGH